MSTENRPQNYKRVGGNANATRSRKFSCITYLTKEQLNTCLLLHLEQIRVYAYAYHDKDVREDGTLKEPHFHLILVTYNTCTITSIRRWFSCYSDDNGEITTTAQICRDVYNAYDYLTHNTKDCIAQNKYQYDKSIVVTNDKEGYFKASPQSNYDDILLATEMLLNGHHIREVGRMFGKNFIQHYGVRNYLRDVIKYEKVGYKDYVSFLGSEIYISNTDYEDITDCIRK